MGKNTLPMLVAIIRFSEVARPSHLVIYPTVDLWPPDMSMPTKRCTEKSFTFEVSTKESILAKLRK